MKYGVKIEKQNIRLTYFRDYAQLIYVVGVNSHPLLITLHHVHELTDKLISKITRL